MQSPKSSVQSWYQSSYKTHRPHHRVPQWPKSMLKKENHSVIMNASSDSKKGKHASYRSAVHDSKKRKTTPFGMVFHHLCSYRGSYLLSPICVKYHRRYSISLPGSEWDRVGPLRLATTITVHMNVRIYLYIQTFCFYFRWNSDFFWKKCLRGWASCPAPKLFDGKNLKSAKRKTKKQKVWSSNNASHKT